MGRFKAGVPYGSRDYINDLTSFHMGGRCLFLIKNHRAQEMHGRFYEFTRQFLFQIPIPPFKRESVSIHLLTRQIRSGGSHDSEDVTASMVHPT
jgi:hypothetical protein